MIHHKIESSLRITGTSVHSILHDHLDVRKMFSRLVTPSFHSCLKNGVGGIQPLCGQTVSTIEVRTNAVVENFWKNQRILQVHDAK